MGSPPARMLHADHGLGSAAVIAEASRAAGAVMEPAAPLRPSEQTFSTASLRPGVVRCLPPASTSPRRGLWASVHHRSTAEVPGLLIAGVSQGGTTGDTDPFVCYIPKRGTTFHLIRWVHVGGEWRSETLVGDYLGWDHEH